VRYADDRVRGFEPWADAAPVQGELRARLAKFALTRHADQTRRLAVGRWAVRDGGRRGHGKPATVDCLGFTPMGGQGARGPLDRAAADDAEAMAGQAAGNSSGTAATPA
jgi:hypothetical protein